MSVVEKIVVEGFHLAPQQRRIWELWSAGLAPASASCEIAIDGELDAAALGRALRRLVERHEVLRTVFRRLPGMRVPVQEVGEPGDPLAAAPGEDADDRLLDRESALAARLVERGDGWGLVLTVSALCADGPSLERLFSELAADYRVETEGGEPLAPPLQYVDFADWQNELVGSDDFADGERFWRARAAADDLLAEAAAAAASAAGPVAARRDLGGCAAAIERSAAFAESGAEALLLALWHLTLARGDGRRARAVAVSTDGRFAEELSGAVGPFAKHLPVRLEVSPREGLAAMVARTRAALAEADDWQETFVADRMLPAAAGGAPPALAAAFALRVAPPPIVAGGARFSLRSLTAPAEPAAARLEVCRRGDDLELTVTTGGETEGLEAPRLLARMVAAVESALAAPEARVEEIDLLGPALRHEILFERNATDRDFPRCPLHEPIVEQAARTPEAVALQAGEEAITYGELARRSGLLAARLVERGVRRGSVVGLHVERGPLAVVSLLAVLRAGAAYVVLPPDAPRGRLDHVLDEAVDRLVLAAPELAPGLVVPERLEVLAVTPELWRDGERPSLPAVGVDDPAYVVYTSGSTGRPKGVVASHRGAVSYLDALRETWSLGAGDVVLQLADLAFDASLRDLLGPLTCGARLVLLDPLAARDPASVLAAISRHGVTCVPSIVPTVLRAVLDAAGGRTYHGPLRLVLVSGEVLRGADAEAVWRVFGPGVRLVNQYGPTECTMTATAHRVAPSASGEAALPVGRPIANTRAYVLDGALRPVPEGVEGELFLGGVGVAAGYLRRPGQTAARFVPDPFAAPPGARLFRTGDLARWGDGGELEFRGRIDQQIKLRGVRVEPGEVEGVLAEHPAVARVAVVPRQHPSGAVALVAYLELRDAAPAALPEDERYELPDGTVIAQRNRYETDFFYRQIFEDHVELRHGVTLADDDVVFDVGANVGLFTLFVHRLCRRPRVFAFEPIPEIHRALAANVERFGLPARTFLCGLSDRDGTLEFAYYPGSSCQSGYYPDVDQERQMLRGIIARQHEDAGEALDAATIGQLIEERMQAVRMPCPVKTVSRVLAEEGLERVDLLKIDVEKSELDVLRGVRPEDWPRIRQVVIEGHDLGGVVAEAQGLLAAQGFAVTVERDRSLEDTCLYNVYAVRQPRRGTAPERRLASGRLLPLVGGGAEDATPERLRAFAAERLPEAMVPQAFVFVDRMPRTRSGKIDRAALPDPVEAQAAPEEEVAPRTLTEEVLAAIWCEVLGRERIGVRDDFFEIGGHSLVGTQVVLRTREAFQVEIPLRSLFEQPTIERLAALVEAARQRDGRLPAPPLAAAPRRHDLPLSFAQERLWFLDRLQPGDASYNLPGAVALAGRLDVPALRRALSAVVRRHETLRSRFGVADGAPALTIDPPAPAALPVVDLSALPPQRREAETVRRSLAEAGRPFDLAADHLLRVSLLRQSEGRHVLVFVIHHMVSDGWSNGLFFRELARLYSRFRGGEAEPLPELPVQYADYALWQRTWLDEAGLEAELDHWRRALADVPRTLDLPLDRPRPAQPSGRGARVHFRFAAAEAAAVRALGRSAGGTLFMTLLAGFEALLSRTSGQERFAVGTPVAGRDRIEVEPLIGFFVNSLVLRADLEARPSLRALLDRVREECLAAFEHQHVPFAKVVEAVNPERSLAHSPLFQVSFALQSQNNQHLWGELPQLPGLEAAAMPLERGTAKFDLVLSVQDRGDELSGTLELARDLFDPATAQRMLDHWRRLLLAGAEAPDRPLAELPLLDAAERGQLLALADGGPPRPLPLLDAFLAQARRRPDAVAVGDRDDELTYAELDRRSAALAAALARRGAGVEDVVALLLDRTPDLPVALLAVLRAGAAFLPLDPDWPGERIAAVVEEARPKAVIATAERAALLPAAAAPLRVDPQAAAAGAPSAPPAPPHPEQLAYVLYTSGSTGRPKGVTVTHRGLASYLGCAVERYGLAPGGRVPVHTPVTFDLTLTSLLAPLAAGATVVLLADAGVESLARTLWDEGPWALVKLTPSHLDLLRHERADAPPAVATVVVGGEALLAEQVAAWRRSARVFNEYGPTETVVGSVVHEVDAATPESGPVAIGLPLPGESAHLVDRALLPVPGGVAGELVLGGDGVARGYLGRPALTAERFVPDPFGAPGGRLYRTGDLARRRPDGRLTYLGRRDEQVKLRGHRVEPGEVEAHLRAHPDVVEAVVVGDAASGRLVAYVTGTAPAEGDEERLLAFLAGRLPAYMVPGWVIRLPALPRTVHGKVDRRALPAPPRRAADAAASPRGEVQALLATVWCEVLGLAEVGPQDDFFDLGGHSLLATKVVARVRRRLGVDLPVSAVFRSPTLAALAAEVEQALRQGLDEPPPPIRPVDRDRPLPMSYAQERLWFLDRLAPRSPLYNVALKVRVLGALEPAALAAAASELVRRHESLRTTFALVEGMPVQVVHAPAAAALPVVDLSDLPDEEQATRLRRLGAAEARAPFDLERGPLARFRLFRLGRERHVLALTLHHIVTDGWSVELMVRELSALYRAFAAGERSPLPEPALQYADFSVWQREWLQGEALAALLGYWQRRLADAPSLLALPTDRRRPPVQTHRGASVERELPAAIAEGVDRLGRRHGTTRFMTLVGAFSALLHRWSGQDSVSLGSAAAGRSRLETEEIAGYFANTLVLRLRLRPDLGFAAVLDETRQVVLEAEAHQDVPFEMLVDRFAAHRDLSHSPLFQHLVAYQEPARQPAAGDLAFVATGVDTGVAKFDLALSLAPSLAGGLWASARYNVDLYDATTVSRLLGQLERLLAAVAADPDAPLASLPLLAPAERHQVLCEWNESVSPAVRGDSFLDAFLAAARRDPVAPALLSGGRTVGYGELDRRSDQVARRLLRLGVGRDDVVALSTGHHAALVVGLLGILKAGGAYLPLDPALPRRRRELLAADAGAVAVVADAAGLELGEPPLAVVRLDQEDWRAEGDAAVAVDLDPEQAAYVIYTSGSTGRPKGVVVSHRSLAARVAGCADLFALRPGDRQLQFVSIGFDVLGEELLVPLACGAAVVFHPTPGTLSVSELAEVVEREGVTKLNVPGSFSNQFLVQRAAEERRLPEALRIFVTGGESPAPAAVEAWQGIAAAGSEYFNVYGPTEATILVTAARWRADKSRRRVRVDLGRPIADSPVHVVDHRLQALPPGVPGEMLLGGCGVARGYLGDPRRTAERFVPDPFGRSPGGRLYRSGDLGRRLADGRLEFLGRVDGQVKLRGHRIELGEVEAAIAAHPEVAAAAVAVLEAGNGQRFLAAWVVAAEGAAPTSGELRRHLRRTLPEPMVPNLVGFVAEIPRTANAKVDFARLPGLAELAGGAAASDEPARDALEERLIGLWGEVLPAPPSGVHANFFDLGGHSLALARLHRRIEEELGRQMPLLELFRHPTIRSQAELLAGGEPAASDLAGADERGQARRAAAARRGAARRRAAGDGGAE